MRTLLQVLPWATCLLLACGTSRGGSPLDDANQPRSGQAGDSSIAPDAGPRTAVATDVDVVLLLDNSISMGDKQQLLAQSIPDLVVQLTGSGAVESLRVSVISSSMGDAGAEVVCPAEGQAGHVPERADMAHPIGALPRGMRVGTRSEGFLDWTRGQPTQAFTESLQELVAVVGQNGCGWEHSLESWYRYLVDPRPFAALERVACEGELSASQGLEPERSCVAKATNADGQVLLDEELLAARHAFLRPDSLVLIVMLTDENDCSLRVGSQYYRVVDLSGTRLMPKASSACEQNPNDHCCYSCGAEAPMGCDGSSLCPEPLRLLSAADQSNLRCMQQKRRFGEDFLYPVERYVNALSAPRLCLEREDLALEDCPGEPVDNPLLAERDPSLVVLAGIVGVPWQALAAGGEGEASLLDGEGTTLRFKTAAELSSDGTWSEILGSPGRPAADGASGEPPTLPASPYMQESSVPRAGIVDGNPINGRERNTDYFYVGPADLQYACIFPMPEPLDCDEGGPADIPCDCDPDYRDSPLCEEVPAETAPSSVKHWAAAYPGLRQLEVLRRHGQGSVVASICARNVSDDSRGDYAYRPAIDLIMERVRNGLGVSENP